MNSQFISYLKQHQVKEEYLPHVIDAIIDSIEGLNESNQDRQNELNASLNEVQKKIDTIEEKFFVTGEMSKDTYEKFLSKFSKEKEEILNSFSTCSTSSSNLENCLEQIVTFSSKASTAWDCSSVKTKENLQKLIFPQGITYDV